MIPTGWVLLLLPFMVGACTASREPVPPVPEPYEVLGSERFGEAATYAFNADSTYVLVADQHEPTALDPAPRARFFVYDVETEAITYEQVYALQGRVRWDGPYRFFVSLVPGIVSDRPEDNARSYHVDVRTGRRTPMGGS